MDNEQRKTSDASFVIVDNFKITGRGLVFTGYITEGLISTGDAIEFNALGKLLHKKIKGVESVSKPNAGKVNIGLLIECENEIEIDELRNWKPENAVALIYKDYKI